MISFYIFHGPLIENHFEVLHLFCSLYKYNMKIIYDLELSSYFKVRCVACIEPSGPMWPNNAAGPGVLSMRSVCIPMSSCASEPGTEHQHVTSGSFEGTEPLNHLRERERHTNRLVTIPSITNIWRQETCS